MSTTSQQPAPPPHDSDTGRELPEDLLVRAAPPREARLAKTRDREADLMDRMEKSMLKAAVKEEGAGTDLVIVEGRPVWEGLDIPDILQQANQM